MKTLLVFCILTFLPTHSMGQEEPSSWTTTRTLGSGRLLVLHWTHQYEGPKSITKIDLVRPKEKTSTIKIYGQPLFNDEETLVAIPNCWDGGCELRIRIVDLGKFKELPPIQFEKESFLECTWVSSHKLKILEGAMWSGGVTKEKIVDIKQHSGS